MKAISRFIKLLLIAVIFYSCTHEKAAPSNENATDSLELVRTFIYGLWSMDSGNTLSNEGYFFKPDGSVDFVAAEGSGNWELRGSDSLMIGYSVINEEISFVMKVDSITEGRMVLSDSDGTYLFRKVPFGMNNEGTVMQGFAGAVEDGMTKEYTFQIPSAKKTELKLSSENNDIAFNIYEGNSLITPTPVRMWTAIMIHGGKYRLSVFNNNTKSKKERGEFDVKVIVY